MRNAKRNLPGDVAESVAALIAVGRRVRQLTAADAVEHDQNDARKRSQVRMCESSLDRCAMAIAA